MSIDTRVDSYTLFFSSNINLSHSTTFASKNGSVSWGTGGVISITTGAAADSLAQINGYLPCFLNQEEQVTVTINAAFNPPCTGMKQLLGMGDGEEGVFVGFNGLSFGMMTTKGGSKRYWTLKVTGACIMSGNLTLTLLDQQYVVPVTMGQSIMSIMYAIMQMSALRDGNLHVVAQPDQLTIYTDGAADYAPVAADSITSGATGVTAVLTVISPGNAPLSRVWIPVTQFNETGRNLPTTSDLTQMQVYRFEFSRWSNGRITFSMLSPELNVYQPLYSYLPSAAGFNTSMSYTPHVFIRNTSDFPGEAKSTLSSTLQTSMANITSGTPSTNTNSTYFSTSFTSTQVTLDPTNQLVIGTLHVPIVFNGKRGTSTSSIKEIDITVNAARAVQMRVIASGGLSAPISSSQTVPWSTLLHGAPLQTTYVSGGMNVLTKNILSIAEINPDQLWLAPGAGCTIAMVASAGAPLVADVSILVTWSES
jgi:hypothetical protein